jgi:lipoyl(octanoyl) transferase
MQPLSTPPALQVHDLGVREYEPIWRAMQALTNRRTDETPDQLWLLQHPPIFTLGQAGKTEHLLRPGEIPVIQVDRGGQVTYHGPGQLILYLMLDLRRRNLGVRQLVTAMEQTVIGLLGDYDIEAAARREAPGVYVRERKIASLGLRVRRGCSFHGLALNVEMDLEPFQRINPCGYPGLEVTQLADELGPCDLRQVGEALLHHLERQLDLKYYLDPASDRAYRVQDIDS